MVGLLWAVGFAVSMDFASPYFRPWEMLVEGNVHFAANVHLETTEIGVLSYRSQVRKLQLPHDTVLSTDSWGYRNTTDIERPRVVLTGDSFVIGVGLSDQETLSARLSVLLAEPVYNRGSQLSRTAWFVLDHEPFKIAPPKIVIFSPSAGTLAPLAERKIQLPPWGDDPDPAALRVSFELAKHHLLGASDEVAHVREAIDRDNGLTVAFKHLYHESRFALFGMRDSIEVDGGLALVDSLERQSLTDSFEKRDLENTVSTILEFDRELSRRGTALIFCPIPESGLIYEDLFPAADRALAKHPSFVDAVFDRLRAGGVRTIDLRPMFIENRIPYLYIRDDTHWTANTVQLTANVIAAAIADSGLLAAP